MTNIYDQIAEREKEEKDILELAPSQNIGSGYAPDYNPYDEVTRRREQTII